MFFKEFTQMIRNVLVSALCALVLAFSAQAALAGCEGCPSAGGCAGCPSAVAALAADEAPAVEADEALECEACEESPVGICLDCCVKMLADEMPCLECGSTEMCEHKQDLIARAVAAYEDLAIEDVELEELPVAYVETMVAGMAGGFTTLFAQPGVEQLLSEDTRVLGVYPDTMEQGFTMESPVYCALTVAPGTEVAEPLAIFNIPAGEYLVVDHIGPYETMDATWLAALAYAIQNDYSLGTGPCFEDYLDDPDTTPAEEMLTQIYIPLIDMEEEEGEEEAEG
jgi:effector-binding domain-containing protein